MPRSSSRPVDRTSGTGLDFQVDLNADVGLQSGLESAIREAIIQGRLRGGDPLPSTRSLAADLGVGRGTVVEAYAQLAAEGWLVSGQGRLTRVAALERIAVAARSTKRQPSWKHDLRPARADPASFPRRAWGSAMRHVLTEAPNEAFDYAEWPGRFELRDAVAQYLRRARGVYATAEDVLACCGAGHGLGLIFRTLAQQGRHRIAVEDPCSERLRQIATQAGMRIVALPCDEQGARTDALRRLRVDAVVVTPAHQFPLGVTMAPDRRTELITWAQERQTVIIEDDYDGELRYDRQPVGALQSLDPEHVLYVGTTSKSLSPALRLGWMVVPQRLHDPLVQITQLVNAMPSSLDQLAFARLIVTAEFDRHIRRIRGMYRERRDFLVDTLAQVAPETRVTGVSAGGHAVVLLDPSGPAEAEIVAMAAADGIAVASLNEFYVGSREAPTRWPGPGLVIGYATPAGRSHRAAIEALGQVLSRASSLTRQRRRTAGSTFVDPAGPEELSRRGRSLGGACVGHLSASCADLRLISRISVG